MVTAFFVVTGLTSSTALGSAGASAATVSVTGSADVGVATGASTTGVSFAVGAATGVLGSGLLLPENMKNKIIPRTNTALPIIMIFLSNPFFAGLG